MYVDQIQIQTLEYQNLSMPCTDLDSRVYSQFRFGLIYLYSLSTDLEKSRIQIQTLDLVSRSNSNYNLENLDSRFQSPIQCLDLIQILRLIVLITKSLKKLQVQPKSRFRIQVQSLNKISSCRSSLSLESRLLINVEWNTKSKTN